MADGARLARRGLTPRRRLSAPPAACAALAAALLLSGCGLSFFSSDAPPLPGERIAVLTTESALVPDPDLRDALVALPPPQVNADWPQPGGNAANDLMHPALGDNPQIAWKADVGASGSASRPILSGPIIAGGVVFAMDALAQVSAYDAATGRRLWRADTKPADESRGGWGGGLAFDGGRVFATTGYAEALALDAASGAIMWRQQLSGPVRVAPTVAHGRVFVISKDNKLHVLNAETGDVLWTHSGIQETAGIIGGASPAVFEDVVIAPYSSGEIFALKVENGSVLWSDNLAAVQRADAVAALADIGGRPVIAGGTVYAASHSGRMAAIDLRSGRRLWEANIGSIEQPWVSGNFVYVVTNDAVVAALLARNGKVKWVRPLALFEDPKDRDGRIAWSGPVLAGDRLIVVGSDGEALSISPYTGEILGRIEEDGGAAAPAVANRTLYFLSEDATLSALR